MKPKKRKSRKVEETIHRIVFVTTIISVFVGSYFLTESVIGWLFIAIIGSILLSLTLMAIVSAIYPATEEENLRRENFRQNRRAEAEQHLEEVLSRNENKSVETIKEQTTNKNMLNFVAIDFETANRYRSSICSVGLTFVEKGEIVNTEHYYVKPIPENFERRNISIHGITPDEVQYAPTFDKLWSETLKEIFERNTVVAHYAKNADLNMVRQALMAYEMSEPEVIWYVCTKELGMKLFPGLVDYKVETVAKAVGYTFKNHHNAEADSLAVAKIILGIAEMFDFSIEDYVKKQYPKRKEKFLPPGAKENLPAEVTTKIGEIAYDEKMFYGKTALITGVFMDYDRDELTKILTALGARVTKSISKSTHYVVIGEDPGPKKIEKMISFQDAGVDIKPIDQFNLRLILKKIDNIANTN